MPRHYKQAFSERPAPWNYKKEEALSGLRRWARLILPSNSYYCYFRISKKIQFSYLIFFPSYKLEFFVKIQFGLFLFFDFEKIPIRSSDFSLSTTKLVFFTKIQFGYIVFLPKLQN